MYVRLKKAKGKDLYYAYLVESVRQGSKVIQKHVIYLGKFYKGFWDKKDKDNAIIPTENNMEEHDFIKLLIEEEQIIHGGGRFRYPICPQHGFLSTSKKVSGNWIYWYCGISEEGGFYSQIKMGDLKKVHWNFGCSKTVYDDFIKKGLEKEERERNAYQEDRERNKEYYWNRKEMLNAECLIKQVARLECSKLMSQLKEKLSYSETPSKH